MEANRDGALDCLMKAKTLFRQGSVDEARRLANKSKKMYSTTDCDAFIEQLANAATNSIPIASSVAAADKPSDDSTTSKELNDPPAKRYTEKQEELVQKILKCKDYYDILGVSRDACEDDLKKSYKKLALKLHPDKNNAPKADDAFKAVSRAYEVLNDKSKRTRYDQLGEEGLSNHSHGDPFFRGGGGFEFDLFREMFGTNNPFGDGFGETVYYSPGGQTFVFRQPFRQFTARNPQSFPPMFLVLFGIPVLFILFSLLFMTSSPFSLHKTSAYSVRMQIIRNKVTIDYYVKSTFDKDFPNPSQRTNIETMVYRDYVEGLWERCSQDTFFRRVTRKNLPTSCQRYEKLTGRKVVR